MDKEIFINEQRPHESSIKHVSGKAYYTDDISEPPDTLYGAIGWSNNERKSLFERIKNNTCIALALIHHLRITYGIPLKSQFEVFSKIAKFLIIEFVPKEDSQVKRLLQNRDDVFDDYDVKNFERIAFENFENIFYIIIFITITFIVKPI